MWRGIGMKGWCKYQDRDCERHWFTFVQFTNSEKTEEKDIRKIQK